MFFGIGYLDGVFCKMVEMEEFGENFDLMWFMFMYSDVLSYLFYVVVDIVIVFLMFELCGFM